MRTETGTGTETGKRKKKGVSVLAKLLISAAVLAAVAGACAWYKTGSRQKGFRFDDAAVTGNLEGMSQKELE